ncbi:MAG: hypothetical protein RLZZ609_1343 [Cyanobacteriota bacterium]
MHLACMVKKLMGWMSSLSMMPLIVQFSGLEMVKALLFWNVSHIASVDIHLLTQMNSDHKRKSSFGLSEILFSNLNLNFLP